MGYFLVVLTNNHNNHKEGEIPTYTAILTLHSLSAAIVVYNPFYYGLSHCYWERNTCLNNNTCKCLVSNLTNMNNDHPLEIVGRGSDTQLQVGENSNY